MRDLSSLLITGGAGFIGTALIQKLLAKHEVRQLAVLDTLDQPNAEFNLTTARQDPRFHFIKGNAQDESLVSQMIEEHGIRGIIHLAHRKDAVTETISTLMNILALSRRSELPLLLSSSAEVYGNTPFPEKFSESNPLSPSHMESALRASLDLLALGAYGGHGQDVIVTRSTDCYGPKQSSDEIIPRFIYHALRDEPLEIEGSGRIIRDWIHVDDCALGIIESYLKGSKGAVYHLGANCEHTILGLARTILRQLGKPDDLIKHIEEPRKQDERYALDVRRSLQILRWKARIPFRSGFENTVRELAAHLRPEEAKL